MDPRATREQGSSTVSYVLLLALFVSLLFGAFYLWKVVALRQSLNRATYLAVRDLSAAAFPAQEANLRAAARDKVLAELTRDGFVVEEFARHGEPVVKHLLVTVDLDPLQGQPVERDGAASLAFEVRAWLQVPWIFKIPLFSSYMPILSARHMGTFVHPQYSYIGRRPAQDPERQDWHLSPFGQ